MNHKFNTLAIQNFRGVRRLNLAINGRNLILVGENGSGKSSVIDALEYCFTGKVEKLKGRADVDADSSLHYFGKMPTEIRVTCVGREAEEIAAAHPQNRPQVPESLASFFAQAANRPFVLRRTQLLEFINARPSERYEHISRLIGLGDLDEADREWKRARDLARDSYESVQGKYAQKLRELGNLLKEPVQDLSQLLIAVNFQLQQLGLPAVADRMDLQERRQSIMVSLTIAPDALKERDKLQRVKGKLEEVRGQLGELGRKEKKRQEIVADIIQESQILDAPDLGSLLSDARQFIESQSSLDHCPVCESPIADQQGLLNRLSERLTGLEALTKARQQLVEASREVHNELSATQKQLQAASIELANTTFADILAVVNSLLVVTKTWKESVRAESANALPLEDLRRDYQKIGEFVAKLEAAVAEQVITPEQETKINFADTLSRVDEHWSGLLELLPLVQQAKWVKNQLYLVYEELIAARKRGLMRLRADLERDFQHLYHQLHPDEGYGSITIPVHEERRSSVGLDARFHEQESAHPLNYFSEGHLDSLGLCIFLAFIKRFNGDYKILVLDDVLTTVDAGHRLRVARLLGQEFSDYQIIITTHDQFWARQLEKSLPRSHLVALVPWSPQVGADSFELLSDWDYYLQQIQVGRSLDAVAGAGRNLEKFLVQMRYNLALSVPARRGDAYTIGDLYGPFFNWLNTHPIQRLDRPDFMQELKALETEFEEIWRIRNWAGAHFNEWAASLSTAEAIEFIETMRQLEQAFSCPVCGHLVGYDHNVRALLCPHCPPQPPDKNVWVYQPSWRENATKVSEKEKPQVRKHAIQLVQGSWKNFLQDMSRLVGLEIAVPLTGSYDAVDIQGPFFTWAAQHPPPSVDEWEQFLSGAQQQLANFWQNGRWRQISLNEIEELIEAVATITHRFHCDCCQNLLAYDYEIQQYQCLRCTARIDTAVSPAYWFIA